MYVCVCKKITEDQLEQAVRQTHTATEAMAKLGVGSDCGTCLLYAIEKLQGQVQHKDLPKHLTKPNKTPA